MEKRIIKPRQYERIKQELNYFHEQGHVSADQRDRMLSCYHVHETWNFIQVLVSIGALLLGAGILSFIASNWMDMVKPLKLALILLFIAVFQIMGWKLERTRPKTARALQYLSIFCYGAGIFLTGQMFHIGGEFQNAFLLWALGIMPLGIYLKDAYILSFTSILLGIYGIGSIWIADTYPYPLLLLIPALYMLVKYLGYSRLLTGVANIVSVFVLTSVLVKLTDKVNAPGAVIFIIVFAIGLYMTIAKLPDQIRRVCQVQGHIIHGITGIILTWNETWEVYDSSIFNNGHYAAILFSILYCMIVLLFIKRGSLTNILIMCAIILRYYVDISYDFLPKSFVFILGGLILIGFGFMFEKQRRKGEHAHE